MFPEIGIPSPRNERIKEALIPTASAALAWAQAGLGSTAARGTGGPSQVATGRKIMGKNLEKP